ANGCESSCSTTVEIDDTAPGCNADNDGPLSCDKLSVALSGGPDGASSYAWVGPNGFSANTQDAVASEAGEYTLTVTAANGCESSCSTTVEIDDTAPELECSSTPVACSGDASGSVSVMASGGVLPYQYDWEDSNNPGVSIGNTSTINNLPNGTYSVTVIGGNGCSSTCDVIVFEPDELACNNILTGFDSIPFCGDNDLNTLYASAYGGTGSYSYNWSIDAIGLGNGWMITNGSDVLQTVSFSTGVGQATFSVIITDENDCEVECSILVEPCLMDEVFCSYTQGFYGNQGGLACIPEDQQVVAKDIMLGALMNSGGQVDFGDELNGKYFRLFMGDIQNDNIFKLLPGGGPSRSLTGYATYNDVTTWSNVPLVSKGPRRGAIKNNLLSQTMTLYFNLYADNSLASYQLEDTFYTAATLECGSEEYDVESIQMFQISPDIIAYLEMNGSATVQGLFELANKALGGHDIGNLSYSSITGAVDAINRGFDECRILLPESVYISVIEGLSDDKPIFTAYPIPFVDTINIRYEINGESEAIIQVYDLQGRVVKTVVDKDIYYHKVKALDLDYKLFSNQMYFIKVEAGDKSTLVKVISVK
ncbi:MAG: T9SS type A sorting domain-containing protein, partial [Flavobacteriaceae bacterium]